jgi:hypothetical protein
MRLFDDLRPRRVERLDLANKTVTVSDEGESVDLDLWVDSDGSIKARRPKPVPIDQLAEREPATSTADRWKGAGIDQLR